MLRLRQVGRQLHLENAIPPFHADGLVLISVVLEFAHDAPSFCWRVKASLSAHYKGWRIAEA